MRKRRVAEHRLRHRQGRKDVYRSATGKKDDECKGSEKKEPASGGTSGAGTGTASGDIKASGPTAQADATTVTHSVIGRDNQTLAEVKQECGDEAGAKLRQLLGESIRVQLA